MKKNLTNAFALLCAMVFALNVKAGSDEQTYRSDNDRIRMNLSGEWESTTAGILSMTYWQLNSKESSTVKIRIYLNEEAERFTNMDAYYAQDATVDKVKVNGYEGEQFHTTVSDEQGIRERTILMLDVNGGKARIEMLCDPAEFNEVQAWFFQAVQTLSFN
ncbi:MAG: hypothetical protein KDD36_05715 [Flavobacteriales bacterium]|nr:hypothetical protein [Flavobacteriales bacterium]